MSFKLSAVIPTKNRQILLKNILSSFILQDMDYPVEFIIVDQTRESMNEDSLERLRVIAGSVHNGSVLKYLHEPDASGLTQAKNIGTRHAGGEIILYLDDDIILLPGFVDGILRGFKCGFDGVSGVQVQDALYEGFSHEFYSWCFFKGYLKDKRSRINRNFMRLDDYIASNVLSGGLTAYKKEVVKNLWFDENLVKYCLGEDKEFSMRASHSGAHLAICTRSQAYHLRHPEGKPGYLQRYEGKTALIKYLHYKFKKIIRKKLWAATVWAITGTLIEALFTSLVKHSSNPLRGAIYGLKKSRKSFAGLEFIRMIGEKV